MPTAKVTSKWQITIPKEIREILGVSDGDWVSFRFRPDGTIYMEAEKKFAKQQRPKQRTKPRRRVETKKRGPRR